MEGDARAEERKIGGRSARGEEARAEERKIGEDARGGDELEKEARAEERKIGGRSARSHRIGAAVDDSQQVLQRASGAGDSHRSTRPCRR